LQPKLTLGKLSLVQIYPIYRISNLQAPPSYWNQDKIKRYQTEAESIKEALQDASPYLQKRLRHKIDEYGSFISSTN